MSERAQYVESLRAERERLEAAGRPERVAQVDAELARFDDAPTQQVRETAVPSATKRAARKP